MIPPAHLFMLFGLLFMIAVAGWMRADYLQGELTDAVRARISAERAIVVLADEHAASTTRAQIRATGREGILAAPESDNGPIAPVLERAFRAADQIGGIR